MTDIILWAPFALTLIATGIIFSITGREKGFWRALIGFCAVLLSALASVSLAKLISPKIAQSTSNLILDIFEEIPENAGDIFRNVSVGVLRTAFTFVVFWVVFPILTAIFRAISFGICKNKLISKSGSMKFLGLAMGFLTALAFTLIWHSPIYGTAANYGVLIEESVELLSDDETGAPETSSVLRSVNKHPIVKISGKSPVSIVYDKMSVLYIDGEKIDLGGVLRIFNDLIRRINTVESSDTDGKTEICRDIVKIMREDVVGSDWFYFISVGLAKELQTVSYAEDPDMTKTINDIGYALDVSKRESDEMFDCLLEFTEYALDHNIIGIIEERDVLKLGRSGIIGKAEEYSKENEDVGRLVKIVLSSVVKEVFDGNIKNAWDYITGEN
ncbi:MAG: hypothetical protein E7623_03220 [Ruminococcaceae bacterium]|nr:hypothetical protein [Oscillospiraceae bacterium]